LLGEVSENRAALWADDFHMAGDIRWRPDNDLAVLTHQPSGDRRQREAFMARHDLYNGRLLCEEGRHVPISEGRRGRTPLWWIQILVENDPLRAQWNAAEEDGVIWDRSVIDGGLVHTGGLAVRQV
jgi:hypothetical protein